MAIVPGQALGRRRRHDLLELAGGRASDRGRGDAPEEGLARGADHERTADRHELVEAAQQLEVVRGGLAEADPGVEQDALLGDPLRDGERQPLLQERLDLRDDVVIARFALHRARLAEHVHQAAVDAALRRRAPPSPGRARSAVTSLTSVAPASSATAATAAFEVSIESCVPAPASPATTGSTRAISSAAATGSAPGRVDSPPTSRMSAPLGGQLAAVRDRSLGVEEAAAVGERVGRHVDDPHQPERAPHAAKLAWSACRCGSPLRATRPRSSRMSPTGSRATRPGRRRGGPHP